MLVQISMQHSVDFHWTTVCLVAVVFITFVIHYLCLHCPLTWHIFYTYSFFLHCCFGIAAKENNASLFGFHSGWWLSKKIICGGAMNGIIKARIIQDHKTTSLMMIYLQMLAGIIFYFHVYSVLKIDWRLSCISRISTILWNPRVTAFLLLFPI